MKAKTNAVLIVVALLAYWLGVCNASAFYDPGTQRWLNRDLIGEPGFESIRNMSKLKPGLIQLSLGSEIISDKNLYRYVGNMPTDYTDPLGLDSGYGNPVSGSNGPVGPSSPYVPGGSFYPNGFLYNPPPNLVSDCTSRCLVANGYGYALDGLGLSLGTGSTTVPLKGGVGPFGSGRNGTTILSLSGSTLRRFGRLLNPYADAVCVLSASYLAGLIANCSVQCANDSSSW